MWLYGQEQQTTVRITGDTSGLLEVHREVRHSCILSAYHFNIYIENVMRSVKNDENEDTFDSFNIMEIQSRKIGM